MNRMFALVALLLLAVVSICGCSGNQNTHTYEVVCNYAVVDDQGVQSDPYIASTFVHADDLQNFIELQKENDQDRDPCPPYWHYVNRQLVQIRIAKAVFEPNPNHPNIRQLVGKDWQIVWRITPDKS